ncbi:MAG: hypothetical protein GDA43_07380 [Hormoscilla sp. SP5CHS1]|nr:hypothetical protein [Hormoscilla sp. SP12CHS1]MBC6453050.1 hypothetical protein [Hormoscilla sp. SP5CHS1]
MKCFYTDNYPPYHSKYNPAERTPGRSEQHRNGSSLETVETVLKFAETPTFKGKQPVVDVPCVPRAQPCPLGQEFWQRYRKAD